MGLHFRKKKNRTEWTVVCFLAFKHQGTVVLFKIVNYVCLRKCQCFLKQNNRVGKDLAELCVAKVSCRRNDVFNVVGTGEGSGDEGTMHSQFFYRGWWICFLSSPNYLTNVKAHKLWPREISSLTIKTWDISPRIQLIFFFPSEISSLQITVAVAVYSCISRSGEGGNLLLLMFRCHFKDPGDLTWKYAGWLILRRGE